MVFFAGDHDHACDVGELFSDVCPTAMEGPICNAQPGKLIEHMHLQYCSILNCTLVR